MHHESEYRRAADDGEALVDGISTNWRDLNWTNESLGAAIYGYCPCVVAPMLWQYKSFDAFAHVSIRAQPDCVTLSPQLKEDEISRSLWEKCGCC